MGYRIQDTDTFREEYNEILLYLVDIADAPRAASQLMDGLDGLRERLAALPHIKAISAKPALTEQNLREYPILNYIVLYRVEEEAVLLEHIFHAKQNYEAYV